MRNDAGAAASNPAMASLKAFLGKLMFPELRVARAEAITPSFRRLTLAGESLKKVSFTPGDKVQVSLDEGARTYTPFAFDAARGSLDLLVYAHGDTPGARWGRTVAEGDLVRVFGPRGSIALAALAGPVVVFGDETSFALARALLDRHASPRPLFEVTNVAESNAVLAALGVTADLVERRDGDAHLAEVDAQLRSRSGATLVLTGKAQSIQSLRARLKARPAFSAQKVKAYWAPGKRGLD